MVCGCNVQQLLEQQDKGQQEKGLGSTKPALSFANSQTLRGRSNA